MNFRINSDDTDITNLANQLRDWEQDGKDLSPERRALLNRAAHMLETCRSQMISSAEELEKAMALKVGYSDSDSRQVQIAEQKKALVKEQIEYMRALVAQRTTAPRVKHRPIGEVI